MKPPIFARLRPPARRLILAVVCLLGLATTIWLSNEIGNAANERLQQRFQVAARERADEIVRAFEAPLTEFSLLQRFFQTVGTVERPLFEDFAGPMISRQGMRCIGWAPSVEAAQRAEFEAFGQTLWNVDFRIRDIGQATGDGRNSEKGMLVPANPRERYFPVLYNLAAEFSPMLLGLDILGSADSRAFLAQVTEENRPTAIRLAASPLLLDKSKERLMLFLLPVFLGRDIPSEPAERRASVRGMLFMAVDPGELFEQANRAAPQTGLRVRLVDRPIDQDGPAASEYRWGDAQPAADRAFAAAPAYARDFALAGRALRVEIDADPAWIKTNSSPSTIYVVLVGTLLTFFLLLLLDRLLRRNALAESRADLLTRKRAADLQKQRVAEDWVSKLSRVVEQNPASIVITDVDGTVEYVNDKFVESTGFTRDEALGQHLRALRSEVFDGPHQGDIAAALASGESWVGELQSQRRDGTHRWERVHISPIRDARGEVVNYLSVREDISQLRTIMTRLMESEARFRSAVSVMLEGLVILSPAGQYVFANRAAEEFFGVETDGLNRQFLADMAVERLREDGSFCPPEDLPSSIALREGREVRSTTIGYRFADGCVRWVELNAAPLRGDDEQLSGAVVTFSEITARRQADEQLKLAFEAIRCSGEGVLVTDAERRILSVNPAFEAVTGYAADEVIGQTPDIVASARHDERFHAAMYEALENTGYWQGEVWNQRKGGEVYPEWLGVSAVRDDQGHAKYFVYIYSDMSERKAAQEHIEFLAHHDPLTGLPNRLLLRDRVEQAQTLAVRAGNKVALLFLDLDRFKTINDSLGHPIGDALLKEVVERLKGCVRESDTICRQGGDEFIILLNEIRDSESAARIAEKIHLRMADPFLLAGHALNSSFSIGIAMYPDDGDDFDSLLQKADTAMYHAKEAGRGTHRFFTEQMNRQVVEHLTLETQLRKAIENKEFVLHYQPQLDLREGTIVGVEALIRWNSPENGLVSPVRFIPVAEVSGLIVPIGAWVIEEACRQAHAWQVAGLQPFVVAVNLSAVQFKRLDLLNTVINALVLSDLDSQWLELELTESILIQDAESTLDVVRRLKALGVKLSVDDFGTGYSSLAYLKRFAVDKLKIDQSFVRDLESDPDDAAIVRAIIQMAHSLKLKTIAEGVENDALTNLLRIFNCDEIQGYGFARPMPADELEAFVRRHQSVPGAVSDGMKRLNN